jgi:hypothetical protein
MIHRSVLHQIEPYLTVGQSHFSVQLMIVLVRTGMRCVEIPVHYRKRMGISKITGSFWNAFRVGCKMILMILGYRFLRFPQLQSSIPQDVLADIGESDNWRNAAPVYSRKDLKPLKDS